MDLKYEKGNVLEKMRENKNMVAGSKADAIYFAVEHLGEIKKGHTDLYLDAAGRNMPLRSVVHPEVYNVLHRGAKLM